MERDVDDGRVQDHAPLTVGAGLPGRAGRSLSLLYVTARYPPFVGGTEIHTAEMAAELARRGHDITVLTTDLSTRATWARLRPSARRATISADRAISFGP